MALARVTSRFHRHVRVVARHALPATVAPLTVTASSLARDRNERAVQRRGNIPHSSVQIFWGTLIAWGIVTGPRGE
jgi:hypothetical protein